MKDRSVYPFILLLWLCCTAVNINKAFYIDDTFHLEAAKWISQHPLQPMSGTVNWTDTPEPIHHFNQPPLYFYILAATGSLFGWSEIPLHIVQSLFTLLAIAVFFFLARILNPKHAKFLTTLFAFCPAFIVNQNLMTDVPLVSLCLLFAWTLIRPVAASERRRYILAALVLSGAIMLKYTALPLFIVLVVSILWKRKYSLLWTALIPVAVVSLWSWWNLREFGYIHIAGRDRDTFEANDFLATSLSVLACIGAVVPFTLSLFSGILKNGKSFRRAIPFVLVVFLIIMGLTWDGSMGEKLSREILRYLFLLNGLLLLFALLYMTVSRITRRGKTVRFDHSEVVLFTWFAGILVFIIQFAPFIATRHILLLIPPVILIGFRGHSMFAPSLKVQALAVTVSLGILLGISDYVRADFYRHAASEVAIPQTRLHHVWAIGHWGWQWYAEKAGMQEYSAGISKVASGDYMVYPLDIARQKIESSIRLQPVRKIWHGPGPLTFFSTGDYASFYMSSYKHPAWQFSRSPVDTVVVFKVIR